MGCSGWLLLTWSCNLHQINWLFYHLVTSISTVWNLSLSFSVWWRYSRGLSVCAGEQRGSSIRQRRSHQCGPSHFRHGKFEMFSHPEWMNPSEDQQTDLILFLGSRSTLRMIAAFWRETGLGIMRLGRLPPLGVAVWIFSGGTTKKEERPSNTASVGCSPGSRLQVRVEEFISE